MEIQNLVTKFSSDTKELDKGFKHAERAAESHVEKVNKTLGNIGRGVSTGISGGGFLPGLSNISEIIQGIPQIGQLLGAIVRPMTNAVQEGIQFNAFLEKSQMGLEGVAGSSEAAKAHLNRLLSFANSTPFSIEGLMNSTMTMTAFGFQLKEQISYLKVWGDAVSATGDLSAEKLNRITVAFGQMKVKGKASAEEILQLTENGIPAWELLAKAIGKTVQETQKLAEKGKLSGAGSVKAITAMMAQDPRYKGQMDRLSQSYEGRLSSLNDMIKKAQADATKGIFTNTSEVMQVALNKQELLSKITAQINSFTTPIADILLAGIKTAVGEKSLADLLMQTLISGKQLGGNAMGLLAPMLGLGGDAIKGFLQGFADPKAIMQGAQSMVSTVKDSIATSQQSNSPAKAYIPLGYNAAEGYIQGFKEGMESLSFDPAQYFSGKGKRRVKMRDPNAPESLSNSQYTSWENMMKLFKREPDFLPKLTQMSQTRGINPDHMLNLMALETAKTFRKNIDNGMGYVGLIQFGKDARRDVGLPENTAQAKQYLGKISATEQLDYVFKYLDQHLKNIIGRMPVTQAQLYASVGAGGATRSDDTVMFRDGGYQQGDWRRTRKISNAGYDANKNSWDVNKDKVIQQFEFGVAAFKHLGAGQKFTITNGALNVNLVNQSQTPGANQSIQPPKITDAAQPKYDFSPEKVKKVLDILNKSKNELKEINTPPAELSMTIIPRAIVSMQEFEASVAGVNSEFESKAPGEYFDEVVQKSGSLIERFRKMRDEMPTLQDQLSETFVKLPEQIGDVFGNAVANWDGTLKGFFRSVGLGFADLMKQMAAELIRFAILKLVLGIVSSIGGAAAGGAAGSASADFLPSNPLDGIPFFAKGGRPPVGMPLVIGRNVAEEGLEVFVPDEAGTILNHKDSMRFIQSWKDRADEHKDAMRSLSTIGGSSSVGVMNQSNNTASHTTNTYDNRSYNINMTDSAGQRTSKLPAPSQRQLGESLLKIIQNGK